ncbi:MAG: Dabb family protein [Bacteroidales bacterium]|nr:Dabb family protein [Bacteroidales bacterium]
MKKILLMSLFLLSTSGILLAKKTEKTIKPSKEIRQIILIKFKYSVTAKEKTAVGDLARVLKEKSKTIQKLDWGNPLEITGDNDSNTYDFCLTFKFKNDTNYEIFQQNPLRMEFMGKLIPLAENIVTYTYRIHE